MPKTTLEQSRQYVACLCNQKMSSACADVEKEVLTDAVWLRAATGGIVCSGSQGDLAVAVNATNDFHSEHCSFRFLEADPNR